MKLLNVESVGWFWSRVNECCLETSQVFADRDLALAARASGQLVFEWAEVEEGQFESIVGEAVRAIEARSSN